MRKPLSRFIPACLSVAAVAAVVVSCFTPSVFAESKPAFTHLRINCGGGNVKDPKTGLLWRSDKDYSRKGAKYKFADRYFKARKFRGEAPLNVYQTVRRANISYRFGRVPNGRYLLRMHFVDTKVLAKRSMDFWVEGQHLVHNFSVQEAAGGATRPYVMELIIDVKDGNGLQIQGSRGHGDDVFISALEVLPAPKGSQLTEVQTVVEVQPDDLSKQLREFAGGPVRVVWTRAMDEEDYTMHRASGILYGFDTEDGKGEREILPGLRSYAMPLLTPDGKQVLFTDQHKAKCYIVGFDGSGLREFADGFVSHVWQDPATGRVWAYVRSGWNDIKSHMLRYDLADLSVKETVWSQSENGSPPVSWFRVSGDGRYSVDTLPWPQYGLIDNQTGDFKILGNGCWPSIAPDDSGHSFLFSGNHTSVRFYEHGDEEGRVINLATVPGWTGRKIYHPRWTHDTRFITVTAPQWMPETELYLGRFDAAFTGINQWFRVTYNDKADFFGDAWFAASQPVIAKKPSVASPQQTAAPAPKAQLNPLTTGLVFVWENSRARNVILDAEGKTKRAWNVTYQGGTRPNRWFGADVYQGAVMPAEDSAEVIGEAVNRSQTFSLSVDIPTFSTAQKSGATLAWLEEKNQMLISVVQDESGFWASVMKADGTLARIPFGGADDTAPKQLALTYADGMLKTWLNGKEASTVEAKLGVDQWKPVQLIFGNNSKGTAAWQGSVENMRVYDRALTNDDLAALYDQSTKVWAAKKTVNRLVVEAELLQVSEPENPETIAPYTRSLGENIYQIKKIISGEGKVDEQIVVLQWVILGGKVLDTAEREEGKTYRLELELVDDHPQLSGEHRSTDIFDVTSTVFYDVTP